MVEFRGVDNLVYAKVTKDDEESYVVGEVKSLAPVAEISKTVETASDTKFYDNKPMLVVNAEGPDTITVTVAALDLATMADLIGKNYDEETGALLDGAKKDEYFALGYRFKLTDGTYRYVWRLKGAFATPDETSITENAGTDTNNQQLIYTGISTVHSFTKGGSARGVVVDERDELADVTKFFEAVTTPDLLKKKA